MSTTEIIAELPRLNEAEREAVLGKLLELEGSPLPPEDEALVESRLAAHHADPTSSVSLRDMKERLRSGT
mgnify:CR=1 FL=1|jgi:hypothetical protein